ERTCNVGSCQPVVEVDRRGVTFDALGDRLGEPARPAAGSSVRRRLGRGHGVRRFGGPLGTKRYGCDRPAWRKSVVFLPRLSRMPTMSRNQAEMPTRGPVQPARSLRPASVYAADYKTKPGSH